MRAVVCRVTYASVSVDGQVRGQIDRGLLAYIGVFTGDSETQAAWLADKLAALRVFNDEAGKMNRSVADVGGGLLLIPNFTLAGRTRKGTRPSFTDAADPAVASALFSELAEACAQHVPTQKGVFGAHMHIESLCDGPVTLVVDTPA